MVVVVLTLMIVTVAAAIDALSRTPESVRGFPPPIWALIALIPLVGPLAWFYWGRPLSAAAPAVTRPRGPDDDEDFLRQL